MLTRCLRSATAQTEAVKKIVMRDTTRHILSRYLESYLIYVHAMYRQVVQATICVYQLQMNCSAYVYISQKHLLPASGLESLQILASRGAVEDQYV